MNPASDGIRKFFRTIKVTNMYVNITVFSMLHPLFRVHASIIRHYPSFLVLGIYLDLVLFCAFCRVLGVGAS